MVWKTLHHPNILPLMGVDTTTNQLAAVYGWMDNGNVNEFTKVHPDANRLELVCLPFCPLSFPAVVFKQPL